MPIRIRSAVDDDAPVIARLVNRAYEVERFFVLGDRTDASDVRAQLRKGTFFVADDDGTIVGSIYVEAHGDHGAFGMLAVDPSRQGGGIGRQLIDTAERHIRAAGGLSVDIQVVNLRDDLLPRYRRLGYVEVGEAPYVHRPTIQPCYFVMMRKGL